MIDYHRSNLYWTYICKHLANGSVLPSCMPMMILAAIIGGVAASPVFIANSGSYGYARELFGETYGMQVFGIVFGFLSVARLNICYSRYWEGVTQIRMMHSKWSDAAAQAVAFDQVTNHTTSNRRDPFCCHLIHLFSQLSAMATLSLHLQKAGLAESNDVNLEWLGSQDSSPSRPSEAEGETPATSASEKERRSFKETMHISHAKARQKKAEALNSQGGNFSPAELEFYAKNRGCAVHTTVNRIIRSMSTRMKNGGLDFAPPIISRIYQELSNGLLAYNQVQTHTHAAHAPLHHHSPLSPLSPFTTLTTLTTLTTHNPGDQAQAGRRAIRLRPIPGVATHSLLLSDALCGRGLHVIALVRARRPAPHRRGVRRRVGHDPPRGLPLRDHRRQLQRDVARRQRAGGPFWHGAE